MDRKTLKKLQGIGQKLGAERQEVTNDTVRGVKAYLDSRKYRADLNLVTASRDTTGSFCAKVKFAAGLGYPKEEDLMALVADQFPDHQIDWQTIKMDPDVGVIMLNLEPSVEMIPVASVKEIPSEFVSIGAGIYKRAADASGSIQEIWTLKKGPEGLCLFRSQDDVEITADDKTGFRAGDVVNTPYGPGKVVRFDDLGNAFVQVGKNKKLVAADELAEYDIDSEKKKLEDYYAQAYGDREFAKGMVQDYGDMFGKKK